MAELRLNHFLSAVHDIESAQYRVLNSLKQARTAFSKNIIYPHLSSLVNVYRSLQQIVRGIEGVDQGLPRRLKEIDLNNQLLTYDYPALEDDQLKQVKELIGWAMPMIQEAIEEGRTIFEFVENSLVIGEVGIVPSYVEEGYLLIPNGEANSIHIIKYELSLFTDVQERYRSLRTSHIKTIPQKQVMRSPQSIKMELMEEYRELPNPATYVCDVDIAFPFEQTVLPIAKRKLMHHLYTQGGMA